ncbi:MAG: DUF4080 domain-containing protein [Lachnospiraceae bacterium]|nr:DUF4080 domain-containing protein [Lachnospiraceae bacterium]
MKKIVLAAINAKYVHSNPGVYSLCAYALQCNPGADIETLSFTINRSADQIIEEIVLAKPDLIGFSCYIWNITLIRQITVTLHAILPDTQIWLGGPEVSYCAQDMLKALPVTGVMTGEGEITFATLVREFLLGEAGDYKRVRGIVTRDFATEEAELIAMDDLPFFYKDFREEQFDHKILYYETSRGCPYMCAYCLSSIEKQLRFKSLGKVYEELQFFLERRVKQVKFVDRTFNCDPDHALAIWKYLKEHDNGVTNFHFEIAAETLRDDALELIGTMRPGLLRLEIGVQSTDPGTLKKIHRQMDLVKCRRVVETLLQNGNVILHLDLIAGLPGEGYERFVQSFNDVFSMRPHELQLGFLKVLKGTAIEQTAVEAGIVYEQEPPYEVLFTKDIRYEELRKLKAVEEMLEIYYNSGQFARSIDYLLRFFPTPYAMFEALSVYYREKGYQIIQSSRLKRYEILLAFFEEKVEKDSARMREYLVYDLYARENLKKRPKFAGEEAKEAADYYRGNRQLMFDTHVEKLLGPDGKKRLYLFDYRDRDPVTGNAVISDITEEV